MKLTSTLVLRGAAFAAAAIGAGCPVYQAPPPAQRVYVQPVPPVTYVEPAPQAVVSVYVEPPVLQPAPILISWAPPPMLVETPAPLPYSGAVWVGGCWVWEGNWGVGRGPLAGSRFGLIVPAPTGTAPAVVTSAAPVVNVGMRIQSNNTPVTNVTNITNVTSVTIVAPASATASGKAFESAVPAQAHLAAALPAVVRAPVPASAKAIPAFAPGRAPVALPAPQMVRSGPAPRLAAPPQRVVPNTAPAQSPAPSAAAPAPVAPVTPVAGLKPPVAPGPQPAAPDRATAPAVPPKPTAEAPRAVEPPAATSRRAAVKTASLPPKPPAVPKDRFARAG
jgi:hypothetical protein